MATAEVNGISEIGHNTAITTHRTTQQQGTPITYTHRNAGCMAAFKAIPQHLQHFLANLCRTNAGSTAHPGAQAQPDIPLPAMHVPNEESNTNGVPLETQASVPSAHPAIPGNNGNTALADDAAANSASAYSTAVPQHRNSVSTHRILTQRPTTASSSTSSNSQSSGKVKPSEQREYARESKSGPLRKVASGRVDSAAKQTASAGKSVEEAPRYGASMATLIPDIAHLLGGHLASQDLYSLSRASKRFCYALAPRRQAIIHGTRLARGEITTLHSGDVIRQNPPVMNQAQFGAVFDHLRDEGRLPNFPLPANFPALTPAVQRHVEIFSWRLSGGPAAGSPLARLTPQRRDSVLDAYTDLMQAIDGMALPRQIIDDSNDYHIRNLLDVFGAPAGMNAATGRMRLNGESQRGNLRLTTQIYDRLLQASQWTIQASLPTYCMDMRVANNFSSGYWPLNPPMV